MGCAVFLTELCYFPANAPPEAGRTVQSSRLDFRVEVKERLAEIGCEVSALAVAA
jgi:hypothetical protein